MGGWRVTQGLEDWDLWWRLAQAGHRFATATERTVSIHEGKGTRRGTLVPRYWAPVLVGSSARTLAEVHTAIESPSIGQRLSRAAQADRTAMYRALQADGAVRPARSAELGEGGEIVAADRVGHRDLGMRTASGDRPAYPIGRGRPLAVVPWRGRYALAAPLYCSDEPHAEVIRGLTVRYSARQRAVLRSLVTDQGLAPGVTVVDDEDPSGRRAAC